MESQGSVIVRVYTSDAFLPLQNATVIFYQIRKENQKIVMAVRTTDQNGLAEPLFVETPEEILSLSPDEAGLPYATLNLEVTCFGYYPVSATGIQVFPGVETVQTLQLRPASSVSDGSRNPTIYRQKPQKL